MTEAGSMSGKVFSGRYQINDRVGIGGMAEVYCAQDNVLGRLVAVKVMLPQYAADPDFTRRFRQEAAAAANLQSPYIVNIYDWGQDDDTYYIVMEFVRGGDLKTAIRQRGAINQHKVAEIGAQVCQALTVAHKQDIIHRDIKPQNIMVQPDGNVKVMDFGIARAKNSVNDQTSSVLGTAHYISPEQAQGKELTAASDIYSLGVCLYEAATGKLPFDGPDAVSVALKQVKEYPVAPHEINPDIDPALEDIILTALEKDPHHRFATANEMRLALNDYLAGRSTGSHADFTESQTRVIAPTPIAAEATQAISSVNASPVKTAQPYNQSSDFRASTQKKSKRGVIIALCAVVVLVAAAAAAYFVFFGNTGAAEKITVPNVVKQTEQAAIAALEEQGLKVGTIDRAYDDEIGEGLVISQTPASGQEAEKGSKVDLIVSQGSQQATVPNLRNMTLEQARTEAERYGFTITQKSSANDPSIEAGRIISQQPAAGESAKVGSAIEYVLSLGTASKNVPYVIGYGEDGATSMLRNEGFNVEVRREYSDDYAAGIVMDQNPNGGTEIKEGATIVITVSQGADPSNVTPNSSSSSSSSNGSSSGTTGGGTGGTGTGGGTGGSGGSSPSGGTGTGDNASDGDDEDA